MTVTLVMPSLPERGLMLAGALSDWALQTVPVNEIRVGVDYGRQGPAIVRNALCQKVRTEWIAFADDDDRFDPNHLETLLSHAADADVVWTFCRIEGNATPWSVDHRCPPDHGQIPMTSLVRTEAFLAAGGFDPSFHNEDEAFFATLKSFGARFQCVHQDTWTYRFHDSNRSRTHTPPGWEDAALAAMKE